MSTGKRPQLPMTDVYLVGGRRDGRLDVVLGCCRRFGGDQSAPPSQQVGEPRPGGQRRAQLQGEVQREPLQLVQVVLKEVLGSTACLSSLYVLLQVVLKYENCLPVQC